MSENPYESGRAEGTRPEKTRATPWLLWPGLVLIALAAGCIVAGMVLMYLSFDQVASSSAQPRPSELSQGINFALYPFVAMWPLGILGLVLTVAGLMIRRPR